MNLHPQIAARQFTNSPGQLAPEPEYAEDREYPRRAHDPGAIPFRTIVPQCRSRRSRDKGEKPLEQSGL
jgi:hypothetical protein